MELGFAKGREALFLIIIVYIRGQAHVSTQHRGVERDLYQ